MPMIGMTASKGFSYFCIYWYIYASNFKSFDSLSSTLEWYDNRAYGGERVGVPACKPRSNTNKKLSVTHPECRATNEAKPEMKKKKRKKA